MYMYNCYMHVHVHVHYFVISYATLDPTFRQNKYMYSLYNSIYYGTLKFT